MSKPIARSPQIRIVAGASLVAAALAARLFAGDWWGDRVDPDWSWSADFVGVIAYPDDNGEYRKSFDLIRSKRNLSIETGDDGRAAVVDDFRVHDYATGEVAWANRIDSPVHLRTGADPTRAGAAWTLFPRFTEPRDHRLSLGFLGGVPLRFVREEVTEHIVTYLFTYTGPMSYASAYAGAGGYPGTPVGAGQEIVCIDDQFTFTAWVEPVTGEIIKYKASCHSGDAIVDAASGALVARIARWSGETTAGDSHEIAAAVQTERLRLLFLHRYLWLVLAVIGALAVASGLGMRRPHRTALREGAT